MVLATVCTISSVLGFVHPIHLSAKCCRVSHKVVSWDLFCLSFSYVDDLCLSIYSATPSIFTAPLNAYWQSNQQVIVTNFNMTSITYLSGAILPAFPLIILSLFIYAFGIKVHLMHLDNCAINGNLIRRMFQHKDL